MKYRYIVQDTVQRDGMLLLTLAPDASAKMLRFEAGQYATFGFKHNGRPTPMRCFSLVSSPNSQQLQFAMQVRGRFTQAATALKPGDKVRLRGPYGTFTVNEEYDDKIVMFAGGIGITPFMSMIRYATENQLNIPMTLLFANHTAANIPFKEELLALSKRNPFLHIVFFASEATDAQLAELTIQHTNAVRGSVTPEYVRQLTRGNFSGSTYFLCGPEGFMKSVQQTLQDNNVDDSRIIMESFTQTNKALRFGGRFSIPRLTYGLSAASLVAMFGMIMVIDVSRNVAHTSATAGVTSQSQTQNSSTIQAANNSTPSTSNTASSTSSTSSQTTASQQVTQYQAPVTSVS